MSVLSQDEIKGFKVLPVRVPTNSKISKIHHDKELLHYIYFKQHQVKHTSSENETNDKSIFVINLPKDVTLKSVRALFRQVSDASLIKELHASTSLKSGVDIDLNKLTNEYFDANNKELVRAEGSPKFPVNTGLVTFVDKSALKLFISNAKKLSKAKSVSSFPLYEPVPSGAKTNYTKFLDTYKARIHNVDVLKSQINVSLVNFNQKEQDEIDEIQNSASIIDDDGFQLVVGKHRKTKAAILGKTNRLKLSNNAQLEGAVTKKSKKKQKEDFYRFQIRERKKQEMNELLMKFREDQARIKALRERKRFRPY